MSKRSKIAQLPPAVRDWLKRALIDGNFSDYGLLEKLLAEKGYAIGKSSIHRYGSELERRLAAIKASTDAAAAIYDAAPDDEDKRSGAVISMIQTEIFDTILKLQEADTANPEARVKLLSAAAKNIAALTRASVNLKRYQADVRDKARAAAAAVAKIAKKGGLTAGAVDEIRREILGIAGRPA